MNEIVQIQWFVKDKEGGAECVTCLELRVLGLLDYEPCIAEISEGATAVRLPGDEYPVAGFKLIDTYVERYDRIGSAVFVDMGQEIVPVLVSERLRENVQRTAPCLVRTVYIPPETFQRGGADGLVSTVPYHTAEENEVVRGFHLALQLTFQLFLEFVDLGAGLIMLTVSKRFQKRSPRG